MKHIKTYKIFELRDNTYLSAADRLEQNHPERAKSLRKWIDDEYTVESNDDDADTMARYQLFSADTTMAFDFNREFITDIDSIKDLIEKYNRFYVEDKSWSGGPPPRRFVEYFNQNYSKKGNASLSSWYPTIDLIIETLDYGTLILGFSIIDKSYKLINWKSLGPVGQYSGIDDVYDKRVLSEITKYIKSIDKLNIDGVIDILNLNVKNKVDWVWVNNF
jgi:hypothetical protein